MERGSTAPQTKTDSRDANGKVMTPLSKAVKAGGFVFVSGMPPQDPVTGEMVEGDIKVQTRQCMENLKIVLAAAGSSMDQVVKTTIFCTNVAHFATVNGIYREYFSNDEFPARTFVTVGSWPRPFDIEIEVTAVT